MFDEIFDRTYQQTRNDMNRSIDGAIVNLWRTVMNAFGALQKIQYSSPWVPTPRRIPRDA